MLLHLNSVVASISIVQERKSHSRDSILNPGGNLRFFRFHNYQNSWENNIQEGHY